MKQILLSIPKPKEISIDDFDFNQRKIGIIVYKRRSYNTASKYAMLTTIDKGMFGFVDMAGYNTNPTYVSKFLSTCVQMALESGREVYQFNNMREFVEWCPAL
jgi:hypothetical protein